MNEKIEDHDGRSPPASSRFFEELFCSSAPLVPLAGALVTSSGPKSDVVKESYLGKMEKSHRRYFVLRAGSHTGPSRLEWYKSREKFSSVQKSSGKTTMFRSNKQGVIYLHCCLGVSRVFNCRKSHTVALYGKDQTVVLVAEDQQEQEDWYMAIKRLMAEEQADEERGEGANEDDDGYCTLPPAAYFKEVWPVTVKSRGVGASKSLTGENRLCLTPTALLMIRVGGGHDLQSVTIPLLSVRRFGHLDGLFFLELGRSAPNGPGEIWMEAREQGDPALAQHIHEAVREAVRALRVLPDFGRSPTSKISQPQKRCRTKYRDKLGNVRPIRPLALQPRSQDVWKSPTKSQGDEPKFESSPSSSSHLSPARVHPKSMLDSSSYVEMKMNANEASLEQSWESVEEDEEGGLGYMTMSPQVSPSLPSASPLDDYVTMESPQRPYQRSHCSSSFDLQTSFNSSISDSDSPLHPSCDQIQEDIRLLWAPQASEKERQPLKMAADYSMQEPEKPDSCSSPSSVISFDTSSLIKALQARPDQHPGPNRSVRRYLFSSCLRSCLQADSE